MSLKENLEHVMKLEGRIAQLEEDNASLNFHIGLLLSCVEPKRNRLAYGTVALRLSPAEARAINSLMARVEIEIKAGNGPSLEEFYKRFENLTPTIDLENRVDDFVARAVETFCAEGLRTKVYDYFANEGMDFTHLA